jgi:hypothetical protein
MRIAASTLELRASHASASTTSRKESLQAWVGEPPAAASPSTRPVQPKSGAEAPMSGTSSTASFATAAPTSRADPAASSGEPDATPASPRDQLDLAILLRTFRLAGGLTESARDIQHAYANPGPQEAAFAPAPAQPPAASPPAATAPARQGWGLRYDLVETTQSSESTGFTARARVTTADGRTIEVEAALAMARTESSTREVHLRAGDAAAVDPLVLNLGGGSVALSGQATFDLDADGRDETMAGLGSGSAYLALDRNGDGTVGSGAELFGPSTGSGFGELAALDQDGNGWVDEGDAAFASLRLWRPGGPLTTLGAAGVGALSTRAVATPFALTAGGVLQGRVAETALFLREDGTAGTVQHVDLVA